MNKKILSLVFLLILLVSVTISYAYFLHPASEEDHQTDLDGDVDQETFTSEIDSTFLDENQDVEIGEMI